MSDPEHEQAKGAVFFVLLGAGIPLVHNWYLFVLGLAGLPTTIPMQILAWSTAWLFLVLIALAGERAEGHDEEEGTISPKSADELES